MHLPDDLKKALLGNSVVFNSHLRAIKDQDDKTHTHQGRELTHGQNSELVISVSANYDSQFTFTTSKASRRAHNTEIGDNNFHENLTSEVTGEFDYNTHASKNMLLANMTNLNSENYLPSELLSKPASFIIFTSSFSAENAAIERSEDHSNIVLSFIESNLSRFEIKDLHLPSALSEDFHIVLFYS